MHFIAKGDESTERLWDKIVLTMGSQFSDKISPSTSSFITTKDGLECNVRTIKGELIANCYSENDRMGQRRWTITIIEKTSENDP
jgi:hypothetical protein